MTQEKKAKICGTCTHWKIASVMKDPDNKDNLILIGACRPKHEHVTYHNGLEEGCMHYERRPEHKLHKL